MRPWQNNLQLRCHAKCKATGHPASPQVRIQLLSIAASDGRPAASNERPRGSVQIWRNLVAVEPPAQKITFVGGFSGEHLYFPKSYSLKIQPNSSQGKPSDSWHHGTGVGQNGSWFCYGHGKVKASSLNAHHPFSGLRVWLTTSFELPTSTSTKPPRFLQTSLFALRTSKLALNQTAHLSVPEMRFTQLDRGQGRFSTLWILLGRRLACNLWAS